MSNQPPRAEEPQQGLQKTLDTYRELVSEAQGILSRIIHCTAASIPVDITDDINVFLHRFHEQRRLEYREGVPAGVRSVLEKPSLVETLLNEPLFPGLIYSTKPSPTSDDGPVCHDPQPSPNQAWVVSSVEESDHMVWVNLVRAFTGSGAEAKANTLCQELNDREGRERQRWLELYKQATGITYGSGGVLPPGSVEEFKRLLKAENLPDLLPHPDYRVEHTTLSHSHEP